MLGLLFMSRLMKEVTAAREALATLKPHTGIGAAVQPAVQAQDVSEAPAADSANVSHFAKSTTFSICFVMRSLVVCHFSCKRRLVYQSR